MKGQLVYFTSTFVEGFKAAIETNQPAIVGNCTISSVVNSLKLSYKGETVKFFDKRRLREVLYYLDEVQNVELYYLCERESNNAILIKDGRNNYYQVRFDDQTLIYTN